MDESVWRAQWMDGIMTLYRWTDDLNAKFAQINSDAVTIKAIVDAVYLDEIDQLSKTHRHVYVISEHGVHNRWSNVSVHKIPNDFYGIYFLPKSADRPIVKDFNCFMNRTDAVRQTWFYLIYRRGWLDRSYVSFNMHQRSNNWYPDECIYKTFDWYHDVFLQSFDEIKDDIKKLVPFRNFEDKNDLCDVIMRTKFSIIVETYFERTDCKIFTEKTWRAIQQPRPWLLFAATGCVEKLRQMGFDVFDDYVDHGYDVHDTAEDCVARQEGMLSEAKRLMDMTVTDAVLADWKQKSYHNQNIMAQWAESWQSKCRSVFDQILQIEYANHGCRHP